MSFKYTKIKQCNMSLGTVTVKPPNKGHVGDNINSHAVSLVERLASSIR